MPLPAPKYSEDSPLPMLATLYLHPQPGQPHLSPLFLLPLCPLHSAFQGSLRGNIPKDHDRRICSELTGAP